VAAKAKLSDFHLSRYRKYLKVAWCAPKLAAVDRLLGEQD
jgi:hypothetical protein